MENSRRYLNPESLAKLTGLGLKARLIVEGFISGLHRSPYRGFSVEFAEHREYVPGDDLRYVDWKVFGKTDRYYLKQYEEETNFVCYILLDASDSMSYQSPGAAMSKLEYAKCVAATIAYLVLHQQDAVGLVTFDNSIREQIRPSTQPSHLQQVIKVIETTAPQGETSLGTILHQLAERLTHNSVVILISDLFDDLDALNMGLKHLRHRRHDVSLMQVIDPAEQDFPFEDPTLFKGLEQSIEHYVEPRSLQKAYRREFESFLTDVQRTTRDLHMDYSLLRTDTTLDVALSSFLTARQRHAAKR
ncbi:MAG: DUF58 domain-containing protein [Planctomycetota bacterium]|nr:DUF58 domain-containing protein [Planctomycetota bacterium]MDA1215180.1 DUF58 domain-containing protein [Planctomycetota bacterium]